MNDNNALLVTFFFLSVIEITPLLTNHSTSIIVTSFYHVKI